MEAQSSIRNPSTGHLFLIENINHFLTLKHTADKSASSLLFYPQANITPSESDYATYFNITLTVV
jgi:hypothetical protein